MIKPKFFIFLLFYLFCLSSAIAQNNSTEQLRIEKFLNHSASEFKAAKYDKALESSKQALIFAFEINDNSYIAQSYNSIGAIYNECSQTNKAIEFYEKALFYAKKVNNDKIYIWIYGNLGSVYYFNQVDVAKGIYYYKKSLYYATKINDLTQINYNKQNLASAYIAQKKYDLGFKQIANIKDEVLANGNDEAKMSMNLILGIYSSNDTNKKVAEDYFFTAQKIAKKNNFDSSLINIYENLIHHYKQYNQPKKTRRH